MDSLRGHHTAAAHAKVEPEAELGERNSAPAVNPVVGQEARGPMAGDRRTRPERVRRLIRRLRPAPIGSAFKRWLKHPAHVAQFAWAVCVALSFALLGLLLLGVFDGAFRRRSVRDRWVEIVNQILNALFTLMTIYQHPELFHHAALLLRWRPGDEKELRKAYCRKGSGAGEVQRERLHLSVVVGLLHLTCFAQYAVCGLFWGYSSAARPDAAMTTLAGASGVAPVVAGLYMYLSPLGRKSEQSMHQEPEQVCDDDDSMVVAVIADPAGREWAGGLLDVRDDPAACWLSCLCTFCVFGWNMERLGFGNMHVHGAMFALLCFAPLWVLNHAATNIRSKAVSNAVSAAGVVLCALGLLYGGFWRARMRRKFGLAGKNRLPFFSSVSLDVADYLQWVFCWGCALAQEVRTGNLLLDVESTGGIDPRGSGGVQVQVDNSLRPLPREDGSFEIAAVAGAHSVPLADNSPGRGEELPLVQLKRDGSSSPGEMRPPVPPLMQDGGGPQGPRIQ
ncbi:uncharacterized protein [Aegilops tauschii subsp. strangulata]|uniref:Uncharacterized protein n=1 Tax=Aegilops tauschii subsp. strangulata TaxID=200361 RepID=A0A453NDV6_AEGTS|nr:uncharacterized protein LOC109749024 [Aegilops tauschii subsp. strangulata]